MLTRVETDDVKKRKEMSGGKEGIEGNFQQIVSKCQEQNIFAASHRVISSQ